MKILYLLLLATGIASVNAQVADSLSEAAREAYIKGDYRSGAKDLKKAIELDGTNAWHYHNLASCYILLSQRDSALHNYNVAISLDPLEARHYLSRGRLLSSFQADSFALDDFTTAIKLTGSERDLHACLIERSAVKIGIRDFAGGYEDAITVYRADSTNIPALINAGRSLDELGRREEALQCLLKALELDSTSQAAMNNLGYIYQRSEQYEESIPYFNMVLQATPGDAYAYSNRGFSKLKLGDIDGARADIERSIKLDPYNPYVYRNSAMICIEKNQIELACSDIELALQYGFTRLYGGEVLQMQEKYCKH